MFGNWTVIGVAARRSRVKFMRCRCICGSEREIALGKLRSGHTRSCGCWRGGAIQERYGRWRVLSEASAGVNGQRRVLCRCDCGIERLVYVNSLRRKLSASCGCLLVERVRRHGQSRTADYKNWTAMIQRCHNPKTNEYRNYGARGIYVCAEWRDDFATFYADILAEIGQRPKGKTIDRVNNDGPYTRGNVRWATRSEQLANSRMSASERGRRGAESRWHHT
jgi:hypothetical protein